MVKRGKGGYEKRKICFKNKNCDHLGKDLYSRTTI